MEEKFMRVKRRFKNLATLGANKILKNILLSYIFLFEIKKEKVEEEEEGFSNDIGLEN